MRNFLEKLERRCLLSVSFDPSRGLLDVVGTSRFNEIMLIQFGSRLLVSQNRTTSWYDAALVKQISVQGLGANDLIMLAPNVTAPATLSGGGGNDTMIAGGGPDSLVAGSGNDWLIAGSGIDTLVGGSGHDTLRGGTATDYMIGGKGDSVLIGGSGANNVLLGGSGNDTIYGGAGGGDFLDGGTGNDLLVGGAGSETLIGGQGDDTLYGGQGNQTLITDEGNDEVYGGQGNDSISCGIGNDTVTGGTGNDTIDGGLGGSKYIVAGLGNDLITVHVGNNVIVGGPGNDTMHAGDGNDTLIAGAGNNQMFGGIGDCVFIDGGGNNLMVGGPGNDIFLNGAGTGHDTIDGGAGFNSAQPNPNDIITNIDFFFDGTPNKPSRPIAPAAAPTASTGHVAAAAMLAASPAAAVSPYVLAQQVPIGAAPNAFNMSGLLVVTGTPGTDTIALRQSGGTISATVNGRLLGVFPAAAFPLGVFVNPGGGNDDVSLENPDGSGAVTTFAYLLTGTGNDVIRGGAGVNFFDMGPAPTGIKTIIGFGTDNAVNFSSRSAPLRVALDGSVSGQIGVEGNRIFIPGNAVIYGGLSDNVLYGNASGNCKLFGGGGRNLIYGGNGPLNLLAGGAGDSTLYGGAGIDTLYLKDNDPDVEYYSKGPNRHTIVVADRGDVDLDHPARRH